MSIAGKSAASHLNVQARYPRVLQALHTGLALLVCAQFVLMVVLHQLQSAVFGKLVLAAHRQCGILILGLVVTRLVLAFWYRAPASTDGTPTWQSAAAHVVHLALLVLLAVLPVLGILTSWSRGDAIALFGLIELPALIEITNEQGQLLFGFHTFAAYGLLGLLSIHLGAILFNRVVRGTNVVERMLPAARPGLFVNRAPIVLQLAMVCGAILSMTLMAGLYGAQQYTALNELRANIAETTIGPLEDLRSTQLALKALAPHAMNVGGSDALIRGVNAIEADLGAIAPKLRDAGALKALAAVDTALKGLATSPAPAKTFAAAEAALQKAVDSQSMIAFQRNSELDQVAAKGHDLIILTLAPTLVMAAVLAFFLARSLLAALGQARAMIGGVADVADMSNVRVVGHGEFATLMRQILEMRAAIEAREKQAAERQLTELARIERQHRSESEAAIAKRHAAEETMVVSSVAKGLAALARGDLRLRLMEIFPEGYEPLRVDFNQAIGALEKALRTISSTSQNIDTNSQAVANVVAELAQRSGTQSTQIVETAAALRDVTRTIQQSSASLVNASIAVSATRAEAEQSNAVVVDTIEAMKNIEISSSRISEIIGLINEIAFQTNILALNAGVEAARAGESGRGFAVVAQEVRSLSHRSAEAARQIESLISQCRTHVESGVRLVGHTGDALRRIKTQVETVHAVVSGIATSSQEQAQRLAKVDQDVLQIERIADQNVAIVGHTTATVSAMSQSAQTLDHLVSQFSFAAEESAKAAAGRSVRRTLAAA